MITVKNLTKTFPNGVQALKNVSFTVQPKEFLVVIGLSGSGKSTLLRCQNRLIEPTSGTIKFQGRPIHSVPDIRRRIGMIFQNFNLIPRYTVLDNVLLGRLGYTPTWKSLLGLFPPTDIENAKRCLAMVGLSEKENIRADQLSGGQQQRVAIARALCQTPEVLLADEPVASLDPATSHTVMDYLRRANRELGLTVICSLHFLSLVREYATRVIALKDGELVYEGLPKEINEAWFKKIYGVEAREIHAT